MTPTKRILATLASLSLFVGCGADESEELPLTKEEAAQNVADGKDDGLDLCKWREWYGDQECDRFCRYHDPDCPLIGPEPRGRATRYPIVLAHGFNASSTNIWSFNGVAEALRKDDHQVHIAEVPPFNSVKARARFLANHIDTALDRFGTARVNIIAHSMGGLDARHVIAGLGYGQRVASLTTISTPHRGTPIADFALGLIPGFAEESINALAALWGKSFSSLAENSNLRAALQDISKASASAFNQANPNDRRVYYQSWAGVSSVLGLINSKTDEACEGKTFIHPGTVDRVDWLLKPVAVVINGSSLRPNDGMVSVESSKWGTFQGCIPADHLDQVGQIGDEGPDPKTSFDHLRFYRNLAYSLAKRSL